MDGNASDGTEQIDHEKLANQTSYDLWEAMRKLAKIQHDVHDLYDDFHTSEDYEGLTREELANDLRTVGDKINSTASRLESPVRDSTETGHGGDDE